MPKKLEVSVVVPDNCDKGMILDILYAINSKGYFLINAKLENKLIWINGDGFKEIDNSDLEMDCLGCDLGKEMACGDCCRGWDNEEDD